MCIIGIYYFKNVFGENDSDYGRIGDRRWRFIAKLGGLFCIIVARGLRLKLHDGQDF